MPQYLTGGLHRYEHDHTWSHNERFLQHIVFSITGGFQAVPMVKATYRSLIIDAINDEIAKNDYDIESNSDCYKLLFGVFGWNQEGWSDYWEEWLDGENLNSSFIVTIDDDNWHETPRVHGLFDK